MRARLVVVFLLMSAAAAARSRPRHLAPAPVYGFGAAFDERDASLVVALVNNEAAPITIPIRVRSDTTQYDWLSVELFDDRVTRTFGFIEDRERAGVEHVTLAPGATVVERIPLADKISAMPNGVYRVRVTWDGHVRELATRVRVAAAGCSIDIATVPEAPLIPRVEIVEPSQLPKPLPSRWPYALGGLALLSLFVAAAIAKRAGTPDGCVPCSEA